MTKSFEELVQNRRTVKDFTAKEVDPGKIEQLLQWAIRAPNHHLNQPWRFVCLRRSTILGLIDQLKNSMPEQELKTSSKIFDRLSKVGALIFVGVLDDSNPTLRDENYAAACAATQNILLGAVDLGLDSYWSTNKLMNHQLTRQFIGWNDIQIRLVAGIWLGYCTERPEASPRKPISEVSRFI